MIIRGSSCIHIFSFAPLVQLVVHTGYLAVEILGDKRSIHLGTEIILDGLFLQHGVD